MIRKYLWFISALAFAGLFLSACGGSAVSQAPLAATSVASLPAKPADTDSSGGYQAQTIEGGNVTVKVTPLTLKTGEPPTFDIALDTHSVDLAIDILKLVVLRDDFGKEYTPTAWDGAGPGGHHREGKIKFAALTTNPRSLTLIVKNLAGIPERAFKWDVAQ